MAKVLLFDFEQEEVELGHAQLIYPLSHGDAMETFDVILGESHQTEFVCIESQKGHGFGRKMEVRERLERDVHLLP